MTSATSHPGVAATGAGNPSAIPRPPPSDAATAGAPLAGWRTRLRKERVSLQPVGEHLNRARRAGLIPFDAIRDDGITLAEPQAWRDAAELIQTCVSTARNFRPDRQRGQLVLLIVAVQAAGMLPQIQRIADEFGIVVHSSGGFDSLAAKHDLAVKRGKWPRVGVLHVGDHDPSFVHLFTSLAAMCWRSPATAVF